MADIVELKPGIRCLSEPCTIPPEDIIREYSVKVTVFGAQIRMETSGAARVSSHDLVYDLLDVIGMIRNSCVRNENEADAGQ